MADDEEGKGINGEDKPKETLALDTKKQKEFEERVKKIKPKVITANF